MLAYPLTTNLLEMVLKVTRRDGPIRSPTSSSCRRLRPSAKAFLGPFGQIWHYYAASHRLILGHFWFSVVTVVILSNNLNNF